MKYLEKTFSAPAGPSGISQREWDYATLSAAEFAAKYEVGPQPERIPDRIIAKVEAAQRRARASMGCVVCPGCGMPIRFPLPTTQPNPDAHLGAVEP